MRVRAQKEGEKTDDMGRERHLAENSNDPTSAQGGEGGREVAQEDGCVGEMAYCVSERLGLDVNDVI